MNRCLELAKNGLPFSMPNPSVGAILVYRDNIIGEGFTSPYGGSHAEVNCINSVSNQNKQFISSSRLYVSLEPCSHFGKTPPCSNLIIEKNITEVIIGCVDTFSKVAGKGIEKLKTAGVELTTGVLEKECRELNKRFFTFHEKNRPYIFLKWAQTQDVFIAPNKENHEEERWITGSKTKQYVHQMRANEMAILVGKNTVKMDNPSLTVREVKGENPIRIVLDRELELWNNKNDYSVFNSDAIKDVSLYKGGMPAEYGGRGSSVMDITMKDGNNKKFGASGGLGVISSRLTLEGPIVKDKGSFVVSGRRSYADVFLKLSSDESLKESTLYFYDLNLKSNYKFNDKNRVYLSGYFGRDVFGVGDNFGFNWGNATGTLRWNHLFSDKLFSNTSMIVSNYDYEFKVGSGADGFGVKASILDYNLKQDYSYFLNDKNTIKFGFNAIYHTFSPGELIAENASFNAEKINDNLALESALYLQNEQKIGELFTIKYGVRYSFFNSLGNNDSIKTFDEDGNQTAINYVEKNKTHKFYHGIEPRLALKYMLNENSSIKLSYNRNFQYIHLLSNTSASSPTDSWVPSSNNIKPQIVDQIALGYFRNFDDNNYEFSIESYYKNLQNQIDYKDGANLFLNGDVEKELAYGNGIAYGAEFYIKKRKGDFTGWLSYTYSRSLRKFDDINNGEYYSARQDLIHDVSIVGIYKINEKLTVSASWVYTTGIAVTFPEGRYEVEGIVIPYYSDRNGSRFPDYHRFDIGVTWYNKKSNKFESNWNFSIYNAYARENTYSIAFIEDPDNPGQTLAEQTALFKIIPSVTYNFKF